MRHGPLRHGRRRPAFHVCVMPQAPRRGWSSRNDGRGSDRGMPAFRKDVGWRPIDLRASNECVPTPLFRVMAGPGPSTPVQTPSPARRPDRSGVDGRVRPGHDDIYRGLLACLDLSRPARPRGSIEACSPACIYRGPLAYVDLSRPARLPGAIEARSLTSIAGEPPRRFARHAARIRPPRSPAAPAGPPRNTQAPPAPPRNARPEPGRGDARGRG